MQNGAFSSLILFMKGANEMNYPTNAVINSVPAASELRKVAGFNPLKFLRRTTSERTGEKVLKLDLSYKRLWFRLACPNGRMVVKPLRVNDQMAVFEAMVYASKDDPEPLARFTSTVSAQEVPDGKFVQAAQDAALNEALENAGFGIQLCDLVEGSGTARYGSEVPLSAVMEARSAIFSCSKSAHIADLFVQIPIAVTGGLLYIAGNNPAKYRIVYSSISIAGAWSRLIAGQRLLGGRGSNLRN